MVGHNTLLYLLLLRCFQHRPDITILVDWALKINYLPRLSPDLTYLHPSHPNFLEGHSLFRIQSGILYQAG